MISSKTQILYVEDDRNMSMLVTDSLQHEGFLVHHYHEAISAIRGFRNRSVDIVLLDVMMDDISGFDLAIQIRKHDPLVPIIFVTAKTGIKDVITGFNLGARDYLKKPFEIEELIARIRIQLQSRKAVQETVMIGRYSFNFRRQELKFGGENVRLSYRESGLLQKLIAGDQNLVTRSSLLEEFWNEKNFFTGRSLDVFISKLRTRLKDDPSIEIIAIRNIGYQLKISRPLIKK
ncbi:MAG: response regulator transcription factor [Bacteroidia bacterium]